jgi:MFS family permease
MEKMDGGSRAWITVFGVFCNYFLMFGFLRSFSALIEPIKLHYSTNYLAVNTVPGAICIGFMLMCLFGGPVLAKFGVRRLAWIFGPIPCLSYLGVYAFAHCSNFWLLMIPYFTLSIAFGMIYLYCIASLKAHFSKKLTLATQLGTMGTPTGQLAIPSILTALIDKYSYANGMLIWAGINFNALAASILLLPNESKNKKNVEVNPKRDLNFSPDGNEVANLVGTNVEGDSMSSSSKSGPKSLFCTVSYWLYVMQQVCVNVGYSSGVIYVVLGENNIFFLF